MATKAEATQRNHQVVEALQKGDYQLAMSASFEGLQLMRTIIRRGVAAGDGAISNVQGTEQHQSQGTSGTAANKLISAVSLAHSSVRASSNEEGAVALFNSAFSFHAPNPTTSITDVDQSIILTSVLLYNVGLSHHLQAMEKAEMRRQNLEKAMESYNMASCLLSEVDEDVWESFEDDSEGDGEEESHGSGVLLLAIAILNNMSHIYSYVQDFDHFWSCIHAMSELLTSMDFSEEFALTDEMIFFFMNSNLIGQSRFIASPAA